MACITLIEWSPSCVCSRAHYSHSEEYMCEKVDQLPPSVKNTPKLDWLWLDSIWHALVLLWLWLLNTRLINEFTLHWGQTHPSGSTWHRWQISCSVAFLRAAVFNFTFRYFYFHSNYFTFKWLYSFLQELFSLHLMCLRCLLIIRVLINIFNCYYTFCRWVKLLYIEIYSHIGLILSLISIIRKWNTLYD